LNILFVTQNLPYPVNSGARLRAKNLIDLLNQNYKVKFLFLPFRNTDILEFKRFWPEDDNYSIVMPHKRTLIGRGIEYFTSPLLTQRDVIHVLDSFINDFKPEIVWLDYLFLGHYIPYFKKKKIPVIYGSHNVQYKLTRQQARIQNSAVNRLKLEALAFIQLVHERRFFKNSDFFVAVSDDDKNFYEQFIDKEKIVTIPNFIDIGSYEQAPEFKHKKPYFCFVGSIDNFQNSQGIKFFMREIWNRLDFPADAYDFFIIGRGAGKDTELQSLIKDCLNIKVLDDVQTVVPYLKGARLSVVPILQGGGTRLKIIESMACHTPVVSTSLGAEGLSATSGQELVIADSAESFAESIMRLLNNIAICNDLARNAYEFVREKFTHEAVTNTVRRMIDQIPSSARQKKCTRL
jgi:glycosyltransferase involved in cell wall biosynthesis